MIEAKTIQKLGELSRIVVLPEDVEDMKNDITRILEYVGQINSVDVELTDEYMLADGSLRSDDPSLGKFDEPEVLVRLSPNNVDGRIKVQKIL